jgi:hypothetical protein
VLGTAITLQQAALQQVHPRFVLLLHDSHPPVDLVEVAAEEVDLVEVAAEEVDLVEVAAEEVVSAAEEVVSVFASPVRLQKFREVQ